MIQHRPIDQVTHFILDTNVRMKLVGKHGHKFQQNLDTSSVVNGIYKEPRQIQFLPTPFSYLETCGFTESELTIPSYNGEVSFDDIEEAKARLFTYAYEVYSANPLFSAKELQERLYRQKLKIDRKFHAIFTASIEVDFTKWNFEGLVRNALSWDFMTSYSYPKNVRDSFITSFIVDTIRGLDYESNYSNARALYWTWLDIRNELIARDELTRRQAKRISRRYFHFRRIGDLVDTEIVHFAVSGFNKDGKNHPVVCFTCDPIYKVKFRLSLYRDLIKMAHETATRLNNEKRNVPFRIRSYSEGYVCVCDQELNILEVVRPSDITSVEIP